MKRHSNSTLMRLTKKELVEYVRMAEHNQEVAERALDQQAENMKGWAPVVHGTWLEKPYLLGTTHECSRCGQRYGMPHGIFSFCPNCGAYMEGGADRGE